MPRKSIKFDLDFSIKDILPKFKVKQLDDVVLNITSFNNEEAYSVEDFQVVMYIACDNDVFMQDSDIHINRNNIIINLDKNMLKKYGRALGEIEVTDEDGTELVKRADDAPEVVASRLAVYHETTEPLIAYYREKGLLIPIDVSVCLEYSMEQFRAKVKENG